MTKYKVIDPFDDDDNEIFDTEEEAQDHISEMRSAQALGAQILSWDNPGEIDYAYDEDTFEPAEYEIEEIEG